MNILGLQIILYLLLILCFIIIFAAIPHILHKENYVPLTKLEEYVVIGALIKGMFIIAALVWFF